jgi:hypothetical protein
MPCSFNHAAMIMENARHIFDNDVLRLKDLGESGHPQHECVLGIVPSAVVIEIRMPLARRASQ